MIVHFIWSDRVAISYVIDGKPIIQAQLNNHSRNSNWIFSLKRHPISFQHGFKVQIKGVLFHSITLFLLFSSSPEYKPVTAAV